MRTRPQNSWVLEDTQFATLLEYVYGSAQGEIWLYNNDLYVFEHDFLFSQIYRAIIDHKVLRPRIRCLKLLLGEKEKANLTTPGSVAYKNICTLSQKRVQSIYIGDISEPNGSKGSDKEERIGDDPWIFYTANGSLRSASPGTDRGLVFLRHRQYPFSIPSDPAAHALAICWHVSDRSPETQLIRSRIEKRFDGWFNDLSRFESLYPETDDDGNVTGFEAGSPRSSQEIDTLWDGPGAAVTSPGSSPLTANNQVADVGLITALQEEADAIVKSLAACETVIKKNQVYRIGYFKRGDGSIIKVALCTPPDMGSVHTALSTFSLIHDFDPEKVILLGIAGGKSGGDKTGAGPTGGTGYDDENGSQSSLEIILGDVVVARSISPYEYQKIQRKEVGRDSQHEDRNRPCSKVLVQLAEILRSSWNTKDSHRTEITGRPASDRDWPAVHIGAIASGSKVIADEIIQREINEHQSWNRKIIALEMEGEGLMEAAILAKKDFILVKGISDMATIKKEDDEWRIYASKVATTFVLELLNLIDFD